MMLPDSTDATSLPLSRLPALLEKLSESIASFFDAKLALFRKEVWDQGHSLLRRVIGIGAGVVLALLGFIVLTAGLVLKLDEAVQSPAFSCFIVGGLYLAVGLVATAIMAKRSSAPLEKTRKELEKDKQWIKTQASGI